MSKMIDMTGWVMKEHGVPNSRLTVIKRVENSAGGQARWLCQCECGKQSVAVGTAIRRNLLSCGCLQREKTSEKNRNQTIIGQRFGRLLVEEASDKRNAKGDILYKCSCDCGNTTYLPTGSLLSGRTTSCGCYKKEHFHELKTISLIGQKFGHLTVLELDEKSKYSGKLRWICQCDCENKTVLSVDGTNLKTGNTSSCGCDKMSKGEKHLMALFNQAEIKYITQWDNDKKFRYPDSNYPIKFDFYLPDYNCAIEYDGEQHETGWGNEIKSYEYIHSHDLYKNKICKDNKIHLIRIPFSVPLKDINLKYLNDRFNEIKEEFT